MVQKLSLGLRISTENNRFALFEELNGEYHVIDDKTILSDVLAKFEKYVTARFYHLTHAVVM